MADSHRRWRGSASVLALGSTGTVVFIAGLIDLDLAAEVTYSIVMDVSKKGGI